VVAPAAANPLKIIPWLVGRVLPPQPATSCTTDEISQKLRINIGAAFVFGQVSLVVSPKEDLNVGLVRSHGVNERLEN
jgi:hypothetical protein